MKKAFLFLLTLFTVCFLSIHTFAATGFISYNSGNNDYDGKTAQTPKKQFLGLDDNGAISVIGQNGGTLVIVERAWIGSHYTLPYMRGTLYITGKYGDKSYVNADDPENPAGGMLKAASGRMVALGTDTVMTDMILFQEAAQNTLVVPSNVTLTITDTVQIITKPGNDYYWKVFLHEGATAILSEEALEKLTIVNRGGTVKLYGDGKPKAFNSVVKMTIGRKTAYVNGEADSLDAAPIIRSGRTMLPVRFIAENLGASVKWDGQTATATVTGDDGTTVEVTIGAADAIVNGKKVTLDSPALIENGRTYLPVRFIAESLGAAVEWDGATSTATITRNAEHAANIDMSKFETPAGHSEYYIDGLTAEELILYFNEVCINSDLSVNKSPTYLIRKWENPIYYMVYGEYTDEDIETLESFAEFLNSIYGFPGMYKAANESEKNFSIYFGDHNKMVEVMGEAASNANGFVRVSYNTYTKELVRGQICYLSTLDQQYRNRVIMHEIFNGIGAMNDTISRKDSIIYNLGITADVLSAEDITIIKMLYLPQIKSGMNEDQCEAVIREFYY